MERRFWNPKNETMPRGELKALQLEKLRRLCRRAAGKSPFHARKFQRAGFSPDQLRQPEDIRRIPFTTRAEWMDDQASNPLFGDLVTADRVSAIRYHLTSGTSGRTPLRVLDGTADWAWISEMWAYGFWGFGVRPADTVFFAFSYGSFIGFWGAHYACEKMGALVIPSGNMTTDNRVRQIVEMGVTTVCATPTYAMRLAQRAAEMGVDLRASAVDKLILSGEPAGSIPATKKLIEDQWGARAGDTAGMTEIGTIMIFECAEQPGGTHIIEDNFIEEVLAPGGDEPVGYGEKGERVVTSFGRAFIPLIRYRTRDMVERVPHDTCPCGRTFDLYRGGIQGRWDDMLLVRGTNVYPSAVEAIVREYREVDEFQILVTREDGIRDEISLRVELKPGSESAWDGLAPRLRDDLSRHHEGLRFRLERAEQGSLPRFELKARRVVDRRGAS